VAETARLKRSPATKRVSEALSTLHSLNVPREQQNERSALTLLALSGMLGITEMMDYFQKHFGKKYAPNTRETVRRFTVHQFVQMGLVLANPDEPGRPINSPDNRYQVAPTLLKLAREHGSPSWDESVKGFVNSAEAPRRLEPRERTMELIPVRLPDGAELKLTAGGQNELVKRIVEEFCPRFTPGGVLVYVGDTGTKRRQGGLVFVTGFLTRRAMMKYLSEIAWETEVWIAEAPSHIIHFNGERFLGPYE